jgi:prepilin-type N-terminal cleavage/methylation domain-containing protein/prepilin-type processing-associated H-X9-DG protein
MPEGKKEARRGFTLVELTIVTVAMVLLAAFVLTARYRDSANRREMPPLTAECRANQRFIVLALLMYARDYDEVLPPPATGDPLVTLPSRLHPYMEDVGVWKCPAEPRASGFDGTPDDRSVSVGYNWLALSPNGKPLRLSDVASPGGTVAFVDSTSYLATPTELVPAYGWTPPTYRHREGKAAVAWLDGHIDALPRSELEAVTAHEYGSAPSGSIQDYRYWWAMPPQYGRRALSRPDRKSGRGG